MGFHLPPRTASTQATRRAQRGGGGSQACVQASHLNRNEHQRRSFINGEVQGLRLACTQCIGPDPCMTPMTRIPMYDSPFPGVGVGPGLPGLLCPGPRLKVHGLVILGEVGLPGLKVKN